MTTEAELVRRHVDALLEDARAAKLPADVVGRRLVERAIEIWKVERDWQDIARELQFIAENLDPDVDHEFMRP